MLIARPGRALSAGAGVALGVGAFVCTGGITATVSQQVAESFDVFLATTVTITVKTQTDAASQAGGDLPAAVGGQGADSTGGDGTAAGSWRRIKESDVDRLRAMDGVQAAAWQASAELIEFATQTVPGRWNQEGCQAKLVITGPGYFDAIGGHIEGSQLGDVDDAGLRRAAVVGPEVATRCGLVPGAGQVMVGGQVFAVIGELTSADRGGGLRDAVLVAAGATRDAPFASLVRDERVVVHTRPGAAGVIAGAAALAVLPQEPSAAVVAHAPDPTTLRRSVDQSLTSLALAASAAVLIGGAFAVANLMMLSVSHRRAEFGMRRAIGATGGQVLAQVLAESALVGVVASALGVLAAAWAIYIVSLSIGARAVIDWSAAALGGAAGVAAALVGGLVPAIVAARSQVAESLRH
jgi:putative ABC transport system permease protein